MNNECVALVSMACAARALDLFYPIGTGTRAATNNSLFIILLTISQISQLI